jgi:acetoacetyl-CoA synthetase
LAGELRHSRSAWVEIFDEMADHSVGEPGELVCTAPFPSMPVAFWNDPEWRQVPRGVLREVSETSGGTATGPNHVTRRDDHLWPQRRHMNPGGVRMARPKIYRQVEQLPEILESIVVGQDISTEGGEDVRIVLFVAWRGHRARRRAQGAHSRADSGQREPAPRAEEDHPCERHSRTISGKITELAVRDVIHGRPVKNVDALANPQALELFRDLPDLRV